jgi:hypothetical protein
MFQVEVFYSILIIIFYLLFYLVCNFFSPYLIINSIFTIIFSCVMKVWDFSYLNIIVERCIFAECSASDYFIFVFYMNLSFIKICGVCFENNSGELVIGIYFIYPCRIFKMNELFFSVCMDFKCSTIPS